MMLCEVRERLGNSLKNVRRSGFQLHRHAFNFLHDFPPRGVPSQLEICIFQRTPKASHSVAVLADVAALGFIKNVAYVFASIAKMFELRDEVLDRLLEENIVFPECVICINQERVSRHPAISPILSL